MNCFIRIASSTSIDFRASLYCDDDDVGDDDGDDSADDDGDDDDHDDDDDDDDYDDDVDDDDALVEDGAYNEFHSLRNLIHVLIDAVLSKKL